VTTAAITTVAMTTAVADRVSHDAEKGAHEKNAELQPAACRKRLIHASIILQRQPTTHARTTSPSHTHTHTLTHCQPAGLPAGLQTVSTIDQTLY